MKAVEFGKRSMKITFYLPFELTQDELEAFALEQAVNAALKRQTGNLVQVTAKALERGSREPIEAQAAF